MNNTGFNTESIDTFKRYEGYENQYIIEYYIRNKYFNSIYASYTNLEDALAIMDRLELWDDYQLGYVLNDGSVTFHLAL